MPTETEMFRELKGKLGEETSGKLISFIQESQQKRFEERWDQLVTKEYFYQEISKLRNDMSEFRSDIHKEIGGFRSDIHKEIGSFRSDIHKEIGSFRSDIHKEIDSFRSDIHKELRDLRSDIHKELRTQLRWLLPLLFGQLGILIAMMVKIFLQG